MRKSKPITLLRLLNVLLWAKLRFRGSRYLVVFLLGERTELQVKSVQVSPLVREVYVTLEKVPTP